MKDWNRCLLPLLMGLLLAAIFSTPSPASKGHNEKHAGAMDEFFEGASMENGRTIYVKGETLAGEKIEIKDGPDWLYKSGGGCADCHGTEGQGGIRPADCALKTPAIQLNTLLSGKHMHGGKAEKHTPYTIKTIRRALEESINPEEIPFVPCMPKWFLEDDDFRDLLFYLKHLGK